MSIVFFSKVIESLEHGAESICHALDSEEAVKVRESIHALVEVAAKLIDGKEAAKVELKAEAEEVAE